MNESLLKFTPYVEKGLVRQVTSPCGRLVLFNYTDKTTFEKAWDEVTLNARGTVYEIETGKVVAFAFPKIFNFEELPTEKRNEILNERYFDVFEKADGSLGIIYFYDGEWRVNTRGSFTSDQAIKGKELLKKYDLFNIPENSTLLCEIIYPENRIILDYGDTEELVLLGSYDNEFLVEKIVMIPNGMRMAESYHFSTIDELIEKQLSLGSDDEGFVVRLQSGERVKFKSKEYLKLAKILSNMTPLSLWEVMKNGIVDKEYLSQLPEEFRTDVDEIVEKLEDAYDDVRFRITNEAVIIAQSVGFDFLQNNFDEFRKSVGLFLSNGIHEFKHKDAMFPYFLKKEEAVDKYIMSKIRPTGNNL